MKGEINIYKLGNKRIKGNWRESGIQSVLWYTEIWKEQSENIKINSAVCYKHINEKGQKREFFYVRSL